MFSKNLKNLITKIVQNVGGGGKFTSNKDAARIIRDFVSGKGGQYDCDDFETQTEENPDANLAIHLCWHFADKYPAQTQNEYCGKEAEPYFLKIADLLENGGFKGIDRKRALLDIKKTQALPAYLAELFDQHGEKVN